MMGDNRSLLLRLRVATWAVPGGGFVAEDLVVGKVFALIWPWKRPSSSTVPPRSTDIPDAK